MKRIALITGASSGMGADFARCFGEYFSADELWLVARRAERLEALAGELAIPCRVIPLDLTESGATDRLARLWEENGVKIKLLINCAGFGSIGNFKDLPCDKVGNMIRLNCGALTEIARAAIPFMDTDSHIIMLASSAAYLPQPGFAVYAATKSYVLSLSRALAKELRKSRIYVTAICPGPVKTEFFDVAEEIGKIKAYKKLAMADSSTVVRRSLSAAYRRRVVYTPTVMMKLFRSLAKILPHGLLIKFIK